MAKIMICDDAAFMRVMIKDILTKNGYDDIHIEDLDAKLGLKTVNGDDILVIDTENHLLIMAATRPAGLPSLYARYRCDLQNSWAAPFFWSRVSIWSNTIGGT